MLIVAHARRATRGTRSYQNAQPFIRELAGRVHLFAHNGDLPGIFQSSGFRPNRFNPIGDTDSERAFCVLLDRMASIWSQASAVPPLSARFAIVSSFASEVRALGRRIFSILTATRSSRTDTAASTPRPAKSKLLASCCCNGSANKAGAALW